MSEPVENTPRPARRFNEQDRERIEHVARLSLRAAGIGREIHEGITENVLPPRLVTDHLTHPWARRGATTVAVYGDTPRQPTRLVEGRLYVGGPWSAVLDDTPGMTILRSDLEVAEETPEAVEAAVVRACQGDGVVERYLSMSAQLEALRAELAFAFSVALPAASAGDLHTAWKDCEWGVGFLGELACVAVSVGPGKFEQLSGPLSTYDGWTIVRHEGRPHLLRESLRMRPDVTVRAALAAAGASTAAGEAPNRSCRGCKFMGADPECEPYCANPAVLAANPYGLVLKAAVRDHCGPSLSLFEPRHEDESCR